MFRLPEAYLAPITTLIVMQSTLGAALPISVRRFAGTAVGALVGALVGTYFPGNVLVFGIAAFAIGLFCAALRVERSAYRYASITLAIVMLISRPSSEWVIAVHRFLEVSIGIAVGLAATALWPERKIDVTATQDQWQSALTTKTYAVTVSRCARRLIAGNGPKQPRHRAARACHPV